MLGDVGDAAFEEDLALRWIVGDDVGFGAHDVDDCVVYPCCCCSSIAEREWRDGGPRRRPTAPMPSQLLQPRPHLLKRHLIRNIIAQQRRVRATIVQFRDAAEPLLPRGVPDLQPDGDLWVFGDGELFCEEVCADGGVLDGREVVVDEAREEGGFAYALSAEDDYLCWEGVRLGVRGE